VLDNGLNTLRAVLVGMAFLASLYLAFNGQWLPTLVLGVGIVAHGLMWLYLWRQGPTDDPTPTPTPTPTP
jgi:hypothetical protein